MPSGSLSWRKSPRASAIVGPSFRRARAVIGGPERRNKRRFNVDGCMGSILKLVAFKIGAPAGDKRGKIKCGAFPLFFASLRRRPTISIPPVSGITASLLEWLSSPAILTPTWAVGLLRGPPPASQSQSQTAASECSIDELASSTWRRGNHPSFGKSPEGGDPPGLAILA